MDFDIEIEGIDQLVEDIGVVKGDLQNGNILRDGAYSLETQIKQNATGRPGPNVRTGALRARVQTTIDSAVPPQWAQVQEGQNYGVFVEYGHRQHAGQFVAEIGKRLVNDFCPAYPFFYQAVDQVGSALDGLCVELGKTIEDDWK